MSKQPTRRDLSLWQGKTWRLELTLETEVGGLFDLTGCLVRAQGRSTYPDTAPAPAPDFEFVCTIATDPTTGDVGMVIEAATTAAIKAGDYYWDVEVVDGSDVYCPVYGVITVNAEATVPTTV